MNALNIIITNSFESSTFASNLVLEDISFQYNSNKLMYSIKIENYNYILSMIREQKMEGEVTLFLDEVQINEFGETSEKSLYLEGYKNIFLSSNKSLKKIVTKEEDHYEVKYILSEGKYTVAEMTTTTTKDLGVEYIEGIERVDKSNDLGCKDLLINVLKHNPHLQAFTGTSLTSAKGFWSKLNVTFNSNDYDFNLNRDKFLNEFDK